MQTSINIPLPLLIFIGGSIIALIGAIVGLVAYFIKDVHVDIKKVIEGLTKAVHGLEIITTNMEVKGAHTKERLQDLEGQFDVFEARQEVFYKDYHSGLDWLKTHLEQLQDLTRKKHRD